MELGWNDIKEFNKKINYIGNVENGVILPELFEEVLFCRNGYSDKTKDIYFSGYIFESNYGLQLFNSITNGTEIVENGIKWARFNKPKTENNVGYAIAYLDENGNGFLADIPNIIVIEKENIEQNIGMLYRKNCSKMTAFKYIQPCKFNYNWDYIYNNKI